MDLAKTTGRTILICVLLSAVTLLTFWPQTGHEFITYDDSFYLTENAHVQQGLTWRGVAWALRTGETGNWHPLTWLSQMLDVQLFGLDAGWHHLTSLLFHTANAVLLFLLLQHMTRAAWHSAFVAALFALHPLHVQSVAWAAERAPWNSSPPRAVLHRRRSCAPNSAYMRPARRSATQGWWGRRTPPREADPFPCGS